MSFSNLFNPFFSAVFSEVKLIKQNEMIKHLVFSTYDQAFLRSRFLVEQKFSSDWRWWLPQNCCLWANILKILEDSRTGHRIFESTYELIAEQKALQWGQWQPVPRLYISSRHWSCAQYQLNIYYILHVLDKTYTNICIEVAYYPICLWM